jgi:hypothetical protein
VEIELRYVTTAVALTLFASSTALAESGPGGACTARSDCRIGLRCSKALCVEEAAFLATQEREHTDKERTIGYFGGELGLGLPMIWTNAGEGAQIALRGGALINRRYEVGVQVGPATGIVGVTSTVVGLFDVVASFGVFVPLSDMVSWTFRASAGGGAVYGATGLIGFAEARGDFVGVAIRTSEHLLVELNVPSFRLMFLAHPNPTVYYDSVMWAWVTSVSLNYAF